MTKLHISNVRTLLLLNILLVILTSNTFGQTTIISKSPITSTSTLPNFGLSPVSGSLSVTMTPHWGSSDSTFRKSLFFGEQATIRAELTQIAWKTLQFTLVYIGSIGGPSVITIPKDSIGVSFNISRNSFFSTFSTISLPSQSESGSVYGYVTDNNSIKLDTCSIVFPKTPSVKCSGRPTGLMDTPVEAKANSTITITAFLNCIATRPTQVVFSSSIPNMFDFPLGDTLIIPAGSSSISRTTVVSRNPNGYPFQMQFEPQSCIISGTVITDAKERIVRSPLVTTTILIKP